MFSLLVNNFICISAAQGPLQVLTSGFARAAADYHLPYLPVSFTFRSLICYYLPLFTTISSNLLLIPYSQ